jgi:hypothetical protein
MFQTGSFFACEGAVASCNVFLDLKTFGPDRYGRSGQYFHSLCSGPHRKSDLPAIKPGADFLINFSNKGFEQCRI